MIAQCLAFEEYRSEFLGHEILSIFRSYEKMTKDNPEVLEDICGYISKISTDINFKNKLTEKENLLGSQNKAETSRDKENKDMKGYFLIKNLQKFYDDLKSLQFFKIPINNWYDFKFPTKLLSFTNDIENYHSLLITKRKSIAEWIQHNSDINPLVQIFLEVTTPFKNFQEIALQYKIPFDFIKSISKQIHFLNFGKIVKKFNNKTILSVNPEIIIKPKLDYDFQKLYNINLYEAINNFCFHKSLNTIFKKHFSAFTNEKFINIVEFLTMNECLVPCNKYILPKFPLMRKYNAQLILLSKSQILFNKPEKLEAILNDFDADKCLPSKNKNPYENLYFEEILSKIKTINLKDSEIFNNIYFLLTPDFDFDEICYLTGYKDDIILTLIKKYKYLFNIIINEE